MLLDLICALIVLYWPIFVAIWVIAVITFIVTVIKDIQYRRVKTKRYR